MHSVCPSWRFQSTPIYEHKSIAHLDGNGYGRVRVTKVDSDDGQYIGELDPRLGNAIWNLRCRSHLSECQKNFFPQNLDDPRDVNIYI